MKKLINIIFAICIVAMFAPVYGETVVDKNCVENIVNYDQNCPFPCGKPNLDLTACVAEGNFGYIAIMNCQMDYEWEFPNGSLAEEFTNSYQSLVLNANPGIYTVTMTEPNGCEHVLSWEIIEDCCEQVAECPKPTDLDCTVGVGVLTLEWSIVPGALGYNLTMIENDEECGCDAFGNELPPEIIFRPTLQPFQIEFFPGERCFSWQVETICLDGTSVPSTKMCFNTNIGDCFAVNTFTGDDQGEFRLSQSTELDQINIYPNPAYEELNINLSLENETPVNIEVFDIQGKLMHRAELQSQKGFINHVWTPNEQLPAGSYLINITTNFWSTTERVLFLE